MKEMDVKTKRRQTREKIQITHAEKQKRAKRVTDVQKRTAKAKSIDVTRQQRKTNVRNRSTTMRKSRTAENATQANANTINREKHLRVDIDLYIHQQQAHLHSVVQQEVSGPRRADLPADD